jgi:hypothetical protein
MKFSFAKETRGAERRAHSTKTKSEVGTSWFLSNYKTEQDCEQSELASHTRAAENGSRILLPLAASRSPRNCL